MNHYPRHVGDYLRKTIGLTLAQDGAYTRMIDLYYSDERPLNADRGMLYADLRCHSKADRDAVDFVLRKYFTETPEGFRNDRCDEEIARFADKSAKARAAGEASGKARSTSVERPLNVRSHSVQPASNHEPITNNQGKSKPPRVRAEVAALPDWIPPDSWAAWVKYRGKSLTAHASALCIAELAKLMATGDPPQDVIEQSIRSGWKGLFPLNRQGTGKTADRERASREIWKDTDERRDERTIDGEATRVA